MKLTPEQATAMFLKLTEENTNIDPTTLDRDAILAHFREIFTRGTE